jgi:hypothetical protein
MFEPIDAEVIPQMEYAQTGWPWLNVEGLIPRGARSMMALLHGFEASRRE